MKATLVAVVTALSIVQVWITDVTVTVLVGLLTVGAAILLGMTLEATPEPEENP